MLRELLHLNYTAVVFQSFLQLTASLKVTQLFFFSAQKPPGCKLHFNYKHAFILYILFPVAIFPLHG